MTRQAKIECKIEVWWVNSTLLPPSPETACSLYGDIFGHPKYGEGEFVVLNIHRADFINGVIETADAYIKLGEPQSMDRLLKKWEKKGGD